MNKTTYELVKKNIQINDEEAKNAVNFITHMIDKELEEIQQKEPYETDDIHDLETAKSIIYAIGGEIENFSDIPVSASQKRPHNSTWGTVTSISEWGNNIYEIYTKANKSALVIEAEFAKTHLSPEAISCGVEIDGFIEFGDQYSGNNTILVAAYELSIKGLLNDPYSSEDLNEIIEDGKYSIPEYFRNISYCATSSTEPLEDEEPELN